MEEEKRKRGRPRKEVKPITFEEEIEKMRMEDAIRCENYLTAEDFYEMYGDENDKRLDKTRS